MIMMTSVLAALLACLLPLLASSSSEPPGMVAHRYNLQQTFKHLNRLADQFCNEPQMRIIPVDALFSEQQLHGKAYFPDVTVLHTCDICTGSCQAEHRCAPTKTNVVSLPFKITFTEDTAEHKKKSWIMETHKFINHTECGCVPDSDTSTSPNYQQPNIPVIYDKTQQHQIPTSGSYDVNYQKKSPQQHQIPTSGSYYVNYK